MKKQNEEYFQHIERHYKEIIKRDPKNGEALHILGVCAAQRGDLIDSYEFMQKAANLSLNTPEFHNNFGNIYNQLNKRDNAIFHYQKAIELDPEYIFAYNNIGSICLKQGDLSKAQINFETAIKIMPTFSDAHYNLTTVLVKKNLLSAALKQLDIILNFNPKYTEAHHRKAQLSYQIGDLLTAIYHYQKCLELQPHSIEALYNLGSIFLKLGKPQEAAKYFLRSISLSPDSETFYNLGVSYMQQDQHKEAIMYFEQTLNFQPNHIGALTNVSSIYLKLGEYSNAAKYFREILRLQPNNNEAYFILSALGEINSPFEKAPNLYIQNLFDNYAFHYEEHLALLDYKIPELILKTINEITEAGSNWNVLDLGCGTGLVGEKIRPFAKNLIGIDLSEKMLSLAKQKNLYDELSLDDINESIKKYSNLDLVIAADTLVYIGNLSKIFEQLYTAVKVGGMVIFTIEKTSKYPYELQKTARFAHSKKYIKELVKKYNFDILLQQNAFLRKHNGKNLEGYFYVLKKIKTCGFLKAAIQALF